MTVARTRRAAALAWLLLAAGCARAQTLCVFDIIGARGPLFASMQEFALQARRQGVDLSARAYVDERVAAEDFKAGQCDAALVTGIRARQFNPFTGSIDSIGGLPDYRDLRLLVATLAQPAAAPLLQHGRYEVAGILPLGAAYLFLRDRRIDSVAKMAGHKIAVLDDDQAQLRMAERIGAQAVSADVTNFAGKFNNGVVDVVAAPAIAYMPLELYKGVGTQGVVVKLPVAQLTFQLLLRRDRFPVGFGQYARSYFLGLFDPMLRQVRDAEDDILFFFPPPDGDGEKYVEMMREARIAMTAEGIYDKRMTSLMKKIRCRTAPGNAECSDSRE